MTASAYLSSEPPDKRVARAHAVNIASRLGSKVISYRAHTLGDPHFCYRVPFHTDDFWCTILIADTAYAFTINPKRYTADRSNVCAALKLEWRIFGLNVVKALPAVSEELGIEVFTADFCDEQHVALLLLSLPVKTLLARIEFPPVRRFFINGSQMDFISELITPEHCAQQVSLLRDLLLTLNHRVHSKTDGRTT